MMSFMLRSFVSSSALRTSSCFSSTTFAELPLKSNRWRTSLSVWLRAFTSSAESTLETISKEFCCAIGLENTIKRQHVKVISCSQSALYPEETREILARYPPDFFNLDAVNSRETPSDFHHVRRLVALTAIRYRSE